MWGGLHLFRRQAPPHRPQRAAHLLLPVAAPSRSAGRGDDSRQASGCLGRLEAQRRGDLQEVRQADAAARAATRSAWWIAATSGCARRRDFSAFSPYSAWIGFAGSCVTPRACAASSAGQLDQRQALVECRVEEERDRDAVVGVGGGDDAVLRRDQVALRRVLEQLADVDDERAGNRGSVDPLSPSRRARPGARPCRARPRAASARPSPCARRRPAAASGPPCRGTGRS